MRLSESQKAKVDRALKNHEYLRGSFHWTPGSRRDREYAERKYSFTVQFKREGHVYAYESHVHCSSRRFYYRGAFMLDGQKKDVRLFKQLLGAA